MDSLRDKPIKFICFVFCSIILLFACNSTAELPRLVQPPKSDGTLSFLVVGDWGRRGSYNQSQVALQVEFIYLYLFFIYAALQVHKHVYLGMSSAKSIFIPRLRLG